MVEVEKLIISIALVSAAIVVLLVVNRLVDKFLLQPTVYEYL